MTYEPTLAAEAWLTALRMVMGIRRHTRDLFQEFDLSGPQFGVLRVLHLAGPEGLKLSEVSDALHVTCGNITSLVDGLEQRGFVARQQHPGDRRVVMANLTAAGAEVFGAIAPRYRERLDSIMSCLSDSEKTALIELLSRVAEHLDQEE